MAWDNASTHQDDEVETVVPAATGRVVLQYLPTYSSHLNPFERLRRHFRQEVTHREIFETVKLRLRASYSFFNRYNKERGNMEFSTHYQELQNSTEMIRSLLAGVAPEAACFKPSAASSILEVVGHLYD